MSGRRVLFVAGTRPEVIKLAPVVREVSRALGPRAARVCVTAQHRDMLDQMMRTFGLRARVDLDVMRAGQSPLEVLSEILRRMGEVLKRENPAMVVVQGDTTTALAGALAAFHLKIPVAHVEAGLRSGDMANPFPEEGNRVLVGRLASLHFAPTRRAKECLLREGVPRARVHLTGNTVVDALHWALQKRSARPASPFGTEPYLLVTMHRRESFGKPIQDIFRAFRQLIEDDPSLRIVYPVHPNPHVRLWAKRLLAHERIALTEPVPYLEFVHLMGEARLILTDSGGITEEAASLHKPVVILRRVTERPELIEVGGAVLAGTRTAGIVRAARSILSDPPVYRRMARVKNPYGDGKAAERIARIIVRAVMRSHERG